MRRVFYDIYRDLSDVYRVTPDRWYEAMLRIRKPFFGRRLARLVADAVDAAVLESNLSDGLRPDARHFLLVNLHQMVMLPLSHPASESPEPLEIESMIRDDVRAILIDAAEHSLGKSELSGYDIIDALSRVKSRLTTNRFEIWG